MHRSHFKNDHYNSYYYANIIDNILSGDIELIGFISNFHDLYSTSIIKPFKKFSAFHSFIAHVIHEFFVEEMYEYDRKEFEAYLVDPPIRKLYAEDLLKNYELEYSFLQFIGEKSKITWGNIEDYHEEITVTGYLEELVTKISHEVFYLLFNNRELMMQFNTLMSKYHTSEIVITESEEDEVVKLFKKDGVLKRVYIPQWVKRAVFFRDRGHCCNCRKDISSLVSLSEREQYDHIVPLIKGGLNDISNIQLLCSNCNQKKGGQDIYTSKIYEKWYE